MCLAMSIMIRRKSSEYKRRRRDKLITEASVKAFLTKVLVGYETLVWAANKKGVGLVQETLIEYIRGYCKDDEFGIPECKT